MATWIRKSFQSSGLTQVPAGSAREFVREAMAELAAGIAGMAGSLKRS